MSGYLFSVALCLVLIAFLVQLLRKRRIREKYAGLWIAVAIGVTILGAFPTVAQRIAQVVGVTLPVNLVFAVAILILLIVCVQLSVGVSGLDEKVRTLTEEVALLRLQLEQGELRTHEVVPPQSPETEAGNDADGDRRTSSPRQD